MQRPGTAIVLENPLLGGLVAVTAALDVRISYNLAALGLRLRPARYTQLQGAAAFRIGGR
jgi:hypothetical protein